MRFLLWLWSPVVSYLGGVAWWSLPLRTKTLGTKLSEPEYAQLEAAARESGQTLSEWCRQVLLASVNGQGTKVADPTGSDQALMAELVALRK